MTQLMREWAIGRYGADWVLALDGDEFLAILAGSSVVPDGAMTDRPISLPWRTYIPHESDDAAELNPVVKIRRRRVADRWESVKVIVPRALALLPNAQLAQGKPRILRGRQALRSGAHGSGWLAHFPLRSPGQYAEKVAVHSLQYQAMASRNWRWGYHYHQAYELLKRDLPAFVASFSAAAQRYAMPAEAVIESGTVVDPISYRGGPLRYTPRVDDTTRGWHALLHYAEDLAHQYAALSAGLSESQQFSVEQQAAVVADLYAQLEQQRKEMATLVANVGTLMASASAQREEHRSERAAITASANAQRERHEKERADLLGQLEELRRSRTWKIGRAVVEPVAWANRLRQRCSQAMPHGFLRIHHDVIPIDYLEIHVAHSCNLRCESCSHYANQGHQGIVSLGEADRWMKLWNQRVSPQRFGLVGGEPTLHPHLCDFLRMSRKNWPQAELRLITNGFLLDRHPDLPATLRDTDTSLLLSVHHSSPRYQERLQPVIELIDAWVARI